MTTRAEEEPGQLLQVQTGLAEFLRNKEASVVCEGQEQVGVVSRRHRSGGFPSIMGSRLPLRGKVWGRGLDSMS